MSSPLISPSSLRGRMLDLNMNNGDDPKIDIQTIHDEEEKNLPQQGIQVKQFSTTTTTTTTTSSSSSASYGTTTTKYTSTLSSSSAGSSSSMASPSFSSFVQEIVTVQQKPNGQDVNQYHDQGMMTIDGRGTGHDDKDTGNVSIMKTSVIHTSNESDGEIHEKQFYTKYDESLDTTETLGNLDLNNFFGQLVDVAATEVADGQNDKKDEETNNMKGNIGDYTYGYDNNIYGYDDFVNGEKYDSHDEAHENNTVNVDTDALSSVKTALSM
jgi:hypothetical protein